MATSQRTVNKVKFLLIALGGALGAVSRFGVSMLVMRYQPLFIFNTLAVNLLGCIILGAITATMLAHPDRLIYWLIVPGFLASFTTFSTFSLEMWEFLEQGNYSIAMINFFLQIIGGILAFYATHKFFPS